MVARIRSLPLRPSLSQSASGAAMRSLGMTRIGFPIDVVVIHRPDHVAIQKRGIDRIGLKTGDEAVALPLPPPIAPVAECLSKIFASSC